MREGDGRGDIERAFGGSNSPTLLTNPIDIEALLKWHTVIEQKAVELGRYLANRASTLDFSEPSPRLTRVDDRELRRRIIGLSRSEARKLGVARSTLHYLRKNAKSDHSFKVYRKVAVKLHDRSSQGATPKVSQACL